MESSSNALPQSAPHLLADETASERAGSAAASRVEVNRLANGLVQAKVATFCKKFCFNNRRIHRCTVDPKWGRGESTAPLCDAGNATYLWMLEQLAGEHRIVALEAKGISSLEAYWRKVMGSRPFWERFKDWRFGRRIRVPAYVKALDKDAHKVFWFMCDGDAAPNIAQRVGRPEAEIARLVGQINRELQRRNHAGVPVVPQTESLTRWTEHDESEQAELASEEIEPDEHLWRQHVMEAYGSLTWQEQFIVDAMVVDGLSAKAVLTALQVQNIQLGEDCDPNQMNVQSVYYFLRKTLAKVQKIALTVEEKSE